MTGAQLSIDKLIDIVKAGGCVKTGVDVYNTGGILLLDKDVMVDRVSTLEAVKESGIRFVPVNLAQDGGLWDKNGNVIKVNSALHAPAPAPTDRAISGETKDEDMLGFFVFSSPGTQVEKRLLEIQQIKKEAARKYKEAKLCVKTALDQIRETGGEFDYDQVETNVSSLVEFLTVSGNPFSYLTQEIFSYDDYLYNHSINVCTIGTAILNQFNYHFSRKIDTFLTGSTPDIGNPFDTSPRGKTSSFSCYYEDDLVDISLGFFLHDIGKILVSDKVLNKPGRLSEDEFEEVKKHSFEYGSQILDKNNMKNSFIKNIIKYHHAQLFENETRCYPNDRQYRDIPIYVRVCKLADMYDAMTSRRCYKEAFNQINVVTELFRRYAKKDAVLQYILHSFVKSIGIYPPGSIIFLRNGQMAYVLESTGPIILPFTDTRERTLTRQPEPIDLGDKTVASEYRVDNRRSVQTPKEVHDRLPDYMKKIIVPSSD